MKKKNILFRSLTTGILMFIFALALTACGGGSDNNGDGVDTEAPSMPTNLTGEAVSPTQIDLEWDPSTDNIGVTGYKIKRDGVEIATKAIKGKAFVLNIDPEDLIIEFEDIELIERINENNVFDFRLMAGHKSVTTNNYSDTGLEPDTTYLYCVCACDAAGNESEYCEPIKVKTPPNGGPYIPTGLTATAFSENQINLNWNASTGGVGGVGYKVFRDGAEIASNVPTTSYSDMSLISNTEYCYRVSAFDTAGNESGLSNEACATTSDGDDIQPPSVPTGLTATAVSSSRIDLSWNASTDNVGVTGYKVLREGGEIASNVPTTSYSDTGLNSNTEYCYEVRAFDAAGNESGLSNEACDTTHPDGNGNCGEGLPIEFTGNGFFPDTVQADTLVTGSLEYRGSFESIANPVMLTLYCVEEEGEVQFTGFVTAQFEIPPVATDDCWIDFVALIAPEPTGTFVLLFGLWDWDVDADFVYNFDNNSVSENLIGGQVTITP